MAEEEEGGGGEAGGSVLKKWAPLAAIVLLCQLVIAAVLFDIFGLGLFSEKKEQEEDSFETSMHDANSARDEGDEGGEGLPFYYQNDLLKNVTANPAGTNGERFLVFDVELGLAGKNADGDKLGDIIFKDDEVFKTKMEKFMPLIKSIVTEIMRSKTVNELEGEFFKEVKDEIETDLNEKVFVKIFKKKKDGFTIRVKDVNVSRLVIQ